jgi:trk system potassium uptake protein TrkA
MKIIIAGAGEVGFHLAKLLSYESQEITLIDVNKEHLAYANDHLDIRVIKGDATSISILKDARINTTELFIAVTSSETTNITASVLAKQLGAKRTIARISNTEFIDQKDEVGFTKFGIDELISPEALASAEIELLLNQYAFNDSYEFEDGALTMLSLKLSRMSTGSRCTASRRTSRTRWARARGRWRPTWTSRGSWRWRSG